MAIPQIYCKKILYKDNVPFSRINYFNRNYQDINAYSSKIQLDNIISISTIKYDHPKVLSGETLELVKKCNPINISLGTITNDYKNYFNIKSTNKKNIYVFWVLLNGVNIFCGVATQQDISYTENTTPSSDIIKIDIKPLTSHFLEYMQDKTCDLSEVEYLFTRTFEISGAEYKSSYLTDFLREILFDNHADFIVNNDTGYQWEINRQPFFFVNADNQYQFLTNGYRKISAPSVLGQYENKTTFFMKLCNCMGWDFSLISNFQDERITLSIKNRARTILAPTASESKIKDINYNTEFSDSTVEYIVIKDGYISAGSAYGTPQGIPVKIISLVKDYSNNGYFFKYADNYSGYYRLFYWSGDEYYMIANSLSEGNLLQYAEVKYSGSTRIPTTYNIENKNILYIEGGENTYATRIDMKTKYITLDASALGSSTADVLFKGNYGSMLFYREGNYIRNYDYYSKTNQFKNNFKMLLKGKDTDVIEVTFGDLFTSYYNSDYRQLNLQSSTSYLNGAWDITELELDVINETTKMKLKKPL